MNSILNTTHHTENYTTLPANITKAQVLAFLHNHDKMISMNPMVTSYHLLPDSASTEFFKHESREYKAFTADGEEELIIPVYQVTDDQSKGGAEFESAGGSWRGGWSKRFIPDSITYTSSMQNKDDGLLSITHAPMGVHSVTKWLIKEADDGSGALAIEETGLVTSNRMLMGFIRTTLQGSHDKLVSDFVAALKREAAAEDGAEKVT